MHGVRLVGGVPWCLQCAFKWLILRKIHIDRKSLWEILTVAVAKKSSSKHTQGMRWMCRWRAVWYCKLQGNRTDNRISLLPLFSTIFPCNLDAEFRFTVYKLLQVLHWTRRCRGSQHPVVWPELSSLPRTTPVPTANMQEQPSSCIQTSRTALLSHSHIWSLATRGCGRSTLRNRL